MKLADKDLTSEERGKARADLILGNEQFLCKNVEFTLLDNLVKEVIFGLKMLKQHRSITLELEGKEKSLNFKPAKASHLSVAAKWNSQRCFRESIKIQNRFGCLQGRTPKMKGTL